MKIALIAQGLREERTALQPWRYLTELLVGLRDAGHEVAAISDGDSCGRNGAVVRGVPVITACGPRRMGVWSPLDSRHALSRLNADRAIWHVGLTSFLPGRFPKEVPIPSVGLFTSPVYRPADLFRRGFGNLLFEPELSTIHLLGLLVPGRAIRQSVHSRGLRRLVTLTNTTRDALIRKGLSPQALLVVPPGLDRFWLEGVPPSTVTEMRHGLGFTQDDILLCYAGPARRLRGLDALLHAARNVMQDVGNLRLLILSRSRDGERSAEKRVLDVASRTLPQGSYRLISGFLPTTQLRDYLAASDIVALPFQLVPSDFPLTVVEAMAQGKPVITTEMGCLPDLVPEGCGICVTAGSEKELAAAVRRLALDPPLRVQMGMRAKETVAKYGAWLDMAHAWDEVLSAL